MSNPLGITNENYKKAQIGSLIGGGILFLRLLSIHPVIVPLAAVLLLFGINILEKKWPPVTTPSE